MISSKTRSVISNILGSSFIKVLALIIGLLTTPAYISYFDNDAVLGVWFTILSILTWILSFDLGIGNGLRNNLVREITDDNKENIKKYIVTSYTYTIKIAIIILVIASIIIPFLNFNNILNISNQIIENKILIIAILITLFAIITEFVLKLITSILNAYQKMAIANLLSVITSIIVLIFVKSFSFKDLSYSLIYLTIVYYFALNIPLLMATIIILKKIFKKDKNLKNYVDKDIAQTIMSLGVRFFIIQISLLIINSTDSFLISNIYGAETTVDYQLYYKIFSIFIMGSSIIAGPIWSIVTKAVVERDFKWIKNLFKIIILIYIAFVFAIIVISCLLQNIFDIWLKSDSIQVNNLTVIFFAIYTSIISLINLVAAISNGIGALKTQFIVNLIGAIVKIPLAYLLNGIFNSWYIIIIINVFLLFPTCVFLPFEIKNNLNKIINKKGE